MISAPIKKKELLPLLITAPFKNLNDAPLFIQQMHIFLYYKCPFYIFISAPFHIWSVPLFNSDNSPFNNDTCPFSFLIRDLSPFHLFWKPLSKSDGCPFSVNKCLFPIFVNASFSSLVSASFQVKKCLIFTSYNYPLYFDTCSFSFLISVLSLSIIVPFSCNH